MQKLVVRNFRQITSAEIEVKQILFLIGEQASGKSTIAKLIYFFKSLKEDYFNLIYENSNRNQTNLEKIFIKKIQEKFKIYFGHTSELDSDFEIIFYYKFVDNNSSQNRFLRATKTKTLQIEFDYAYFGEILNNTKELSKAIDDFTNRQLDANEANYIVIERTKSRFINELTERINTLFFDNYSPMFFPAGRNITVSYPEQFQALFLGNLYASNNNAKSVDMLLMQSFILHSKFLNDYFRSSNFESKNRNNTNNQISDDILNFFKIHAEYILQGKYDNVNGTERIVFNNKKTSIPLNIASSGQQESIRIIQDLYYLLLENQKSFRIIEEPEAHLYPKAQKKILELIALIVNKTSSQIVITTHSPYILSILNNLLMYSVVCEANPKTLKSISEHFSTTKLNAAQNERINLLSSQVQAYALSIHDENYCISVIDSETGLIGNNFLDTVTEELNNDFDVLYHLNFQTQ